MKKINNSASNYMFKANNRNTRTRCEICLKLTIPIFGVSSLQVKYDIFRNGDEVGRSTYNNTNNTGSLIRNFKYVPDIVADGRSLFGEGI